MQNKPDLRGFLQFTQDYTYVPVWTELFEDALTPVAVGKKIGQERLAYLLESVEGGEHLGRFSFMGLDPMLILKVEKEGRITICQGKGCTEKVREDPFVTLESLLASLQGPEFPDLPRFYGGLVGYVSYETVGYIEKLPVRLETPAFPQMHFVMAEKLIIFDQVFKKIYLVNLVEAKEGEAGYKRATEELRRLKALLLKPKSQQKISVKTPYKPLISSNFSKEGFIKAVERAKEYIRAGDILQVVLSQRMEVSHRNKPFDVYRALRSVNPTPYLYYLNQGNFQIIGSSPEMLVRVEQGIVETRPIAGTRPRGHTAAEDRELAQELLGHPKERAEHIMLVDLGRNDLGKVCQFGSVKVTELMATERFSHVMHLVSTVQGELNPGLSPLKALLACFPAGTVSGAPKVRAMQIISELEPQERGIYAGAT